MQAAHRAARPGGARFVIGRWNDRNERALMLVPEGHRVSAELPLRALVRVTPSGRTGRLDGAAVMG